MRECTICGTARAVTRFRRADPAAVNAARQPESRRSLDPAVSPEPRRSPTSLLLALPDDVLQRVLVGVPRDDHDVAALVCKRTRGIITGPRFLAARRLYGFAEYCVVTVSNGDGVLQIKTAHKGDIMATIPTDRLSYYSTTTDGGARLSVPRAGHLCRRQRARAAFPVKFWRWIPRHADGDVSQRCHRSEICTASCGMLVSCT